MKQTEYEASSAHPARQEFERQVDELLATDNGLNVWCWLRRRASKLVELEIIPGGARDYPSSEELNEIGTSDVSGKLFQLWNDWRKYSEIAPRGSINDNLGWYINGEICDAMDIPRTFATEHLHDKKHS